MSPVAIYILLVLILIVLSVGVRVYRHTPTRLCHLCGARVELGKSRCQVCGYRFIN